MKEEIRAQLTRIHRAVNDGTVDKDAINAALKEILHLTEDTVHRDKTTVRGHK